MADETDSIIENFRTMEELPDIRVRLAALETGLGMVDSSSDWSEGQPEPISRWARCRYCVRRSVTVPMFFAVTVIVAICVIIFCIFPASILLVVAVSLYYCCARDPIPFRVLLTAMLGAEANDAGGNAQPARTPEEIHAAVVKRRCLGATTLQSHQVEKDQIILETDDGNILFSQPLSVEELEGKDQASPWLVGNSSDDADAGSMGIELPTVQDPETGDQRPEEDQQTSDDTNETSLVVDSKEEPPDLDPDTEQKTVVPDDAEATSCSQTTTNGTTTVSGGATNVEQDDTHVEEDLEIQNKAVATEPNETAETEAKEEQPLPPSIDDSEVHSCDICLLAFEKGQIVAWSHNAQCEHAYHLDCITDWLIKQKTCPNCRADYLRQK